jgi:HD-GYP domain-containing protein (c-di-GMP phosphodiesterase class II)
MTTTFTTESIVAKLLQVLRLRDRAIADHGQRTAEVAVAIGTRMGCSVDTLDRLYMASQLHDLGKLGVPESILWKPAGLNHAEWREIRTHPEAGHRLVADVVHRDVAAAVLYHHERADGDGYPFGLDARSVPLTAKIVQVADAFDAMTSDRPYQPALPTITALAEIDRCSGSQFDPEVAEALQGVFDHGEMPITRASPVPKPAGDGPADPFTDSPTLVRLRDRPLP